MPSRRELWSKSNSASRTDGHWVKIATAKGNGLYLAIRASSITANCARDRHASCGYVIVCCGEFTVPVPLLDGRLQDLGRWSPVLEASVKQCHEGPISNMRK